MLEQGRSKMKSRTRITLLSALTFCTLLAGSLSACTSNQVEQNTTQQNAPVTSAKIEFSALETPAKLDQTVNLQLNVSSPDAGAVTVHVDGGSYLELPQALTTINFQAPGQKTVTIQATPRHVTDITIRAIAETANWHQRTEMVFAVGNGAKSTLSALARKKAKNGLDVYEDPVEFHQVQERARLSKKRDQPLDGFVPHKKSEPTGDAAISHYLFQTGTTPIDPDQLEEPPPSAGKPLTNPKSASSLNGSRLRAKGLWCGNGPTQTVHFNITNWGYPTEPGNPYYGGYKLRKSEIVVYDDNGGSRTEVARGYLDYTGSFSFITPGCDTSGWFDWSSWDAVYEIRTTTQYPQYWGPITAILSNDQGIGLDFAFLVTTGTYWDQQTTDRTLVFNAPDGGGTKGLWTQTLMNYAYEMTNVSAPISVRMGAFSSAFSPIGQVIQGTTFKSSTTGAVYSAWDTIYPLWHEYGHNTLYHQAYDSATYSYCQPSNRLCAPDFAPLLNNCINPGSAGFIFCVGYEHRPENYTYFFATNEGWAETTHQIMANWFKANIGSPSGFLNDPNVINMRYCGKASSCPFATSTAYSYKTQNEYYVGTMFFRLITEVMADWPAHVIKTGTGTSTKYTTVDVVPTLAQANAALGIWSSVKLRLPRNGTAKLTPFDVAKAIFAVWPARTIGSAGKICDILKDMDIPLSELQKFTVPAWVSCS
jgi:hypothetical protein